MFLNLSPGSDLYILDTKDRYRLLVGQVVKTSPSIPNQNNYNSRIMYSPFTNSLDITVSIDGQDKEFKQIPSNLSIADFGSVGFVLAESKEAIINHLTTTLQNSESVVASAPRHSQIAEDCKALLVKLNPKLAAEAKRDDTINELKNQVASLTEQLSQVITALKPETKKE